MVQKQSTAKWYSAAAKIGLTAKGIVYCLSGTIALTAALDIGNTDTNDAGKKRSLLFYSRMLCIKILHRGSSLQASQVILQEELYG